jgi:hypothetical protein
MKTLEILTKEFIQFKYKRYKETLQDREASIATKFALDDMMNQYNQYKRNISEEYALSFFEEELKFYKSGLKFYQGE